MSLRSEDGRLLKVKNPAVIGKDGKTLLEPQQEGFSKNFGFKLPHLPSPFLILAGGLGLVFGALFLWIAVWGFGLWALLALLGYFQIFKTRHANLE